MAPRQIFAGNWKMHTNLADASELVQGILDGLKHALAREIIVFPPAVHLREMARLCEGTAVKVGAQNMHYESQGAFTGEISPSMVVDTGAAHVLIGHSERRHVFGETDDDVSKKIMAALNHDLRPMVCVGELLEERESGTSERVVEKQLQAAFSGLESGQMKSVAIAYEPVWAIGTGKVATPEIADSMHGYIRNVISGIFDDDIAENIPILYGGSVKPDNITGLYARKNIDGVLVGGASLKKESFLDIINADS